METVVLLWHVHRVGDDDCEKLIGVYATEADAQAAIERVKGNPGFSDTPEGFTYETYELNVDHWVDGYREEPV